MNPNQSQNQTRPNILLIFPDQHRGDWVEMNPNLPVKTPNLKRMSENGVYFPNALTPSPLCAPARSCIASGREYDHCNIINNSQPHPLDEVTFYKLLQNSGYHTMACGKFDLNKPGHDMGKEGKHLNNPNDLFDIWGFCEGIDNGGKRDQIRCYVNAKYEMGPYMHYLDQKGLAKTHVRDFKTRPFQKIKPTPLKDEDYCDNWIGRNALKLLRSAPEEKPWFLQVNFNGPHEPLDVTKRMRNRWKTANFPQPYDNRQFTKRRNNMIRQNYSAMVENLDRWVGILTNELKKNGQLGNTLIVYCSDHGESLMDHGLNGKTVPYHPSANIPLVIQGPSVKPNRIVKHPTTLVDLAATFLDYANVEVPPEMDSRSNRSILEGSETPIREVVRSGLMTWRLAYDGRYKLIVGYDHSQARKKGVKRGAPKIPNNSPIILYDLKNDPHEMHNLAAELPEIVEKLKKTLEQ